MLIVVGSDHGGWELKEFLRTYLQSQSHIVEDVGCYNSTSVDYPDFAHQLVQRILSHKSERGVLICGTGIGMSITANRFSGIRAALCHDLYTARMSREHNNSNILVLGGRLLGKGLAEEIVKVWLYTKFIDPDGRHNQRLQQIEEI